jgi:pimeloyl-ACP methyl ester carboxylesterase
MTYASGLATTAVFVHGNPETADIWGPLIKALDRDDVVTLSPPGFGAPASESFGATSDDYVVWLVDELESLGRPVDLVGHDWGGGHVVRVACDRSDLLRSWATDIAGCFAPDYVWHDLAQAWQTPGAGEKALAEWQASPPAERAAGLASLGMTPDVALAVANAYDEVMGRCILSLYRSAAQPAMARWGEQLPAAAARPGLVLIPTEDTFTGGEARARGSASRAQAEVEVLDQLGHWWMLQDPVRGAEALSRFWAGLD